MHAPSGVKRPFKNTRGCKTKHPTLHRYERFCVPLPHKVARHCLERIPSPNGERVLAAAQGAAAHAGPGHAQDRGRAGRAGRDPGA